MPERKIVFIVFITLPLSLEFTIVNQFYYYQQYPWPPPDITNAHIHKKWPFFVKGKIQNKDIEEIVTIINAMENIDKRILFIILKKDGTIGVETGYLSAPLVGYGDKIILKKEKKQWKVVSTGKWIT